MDTVVNPIPIFGGLILSAAIVIMAVVLGFLRGKRSTGPWRLYSNPLYITTAVLITLAFVLAQAEGFALLEPPYSVGSILSRFINSIHDTFQTVSLDGSPYIGEENLLPLGWDPFYAWLYLIYQGLIFVLAPATAFSSAAFFFFTLLASPALWLRSRKSDTYVFSEVNSSALTLAKSIFAYAKSKSGSKPVIAFAEVDNADEALVDEARAMGVICSDRSITELATRCSTKTKRFFIFSSTNEAQNLREALKLTKVFADAEEEVAEQPTVMVFSNSALSDGYVDSAVAMCSGTAKFRRFDHTQNTISQVLMKMPVFLNVTPHEVDSELERVALYSTTPRRILIIGAGSMGSAFLKGALWSGQSNVAQMHIDIFDTKAIAAKRRLSLECPEIAGNLGTRDSSNPHDEAYDVEFHPWNVFSDKFDTFMRDHGEEVTYVFVALGDDLLTAQAARRLRELLERSRVTSGDANATQPPIVAVIDDTLVSSSVEDASSPKGQSYCITAVGSTESLFSYENVFHPKLERWAMNLNAAYWGYFDTEDEKKRAEILRGANESYDVVEYNRISSRAAAIFLKQHLFEFCRGMKSGVLPVAGKGAKLSLPSVKDWTLPLDSPEFSEVLDAYEAFVNSPSTPREPLQELEHRRWNAFMRTLGYERCDEAALETINAHITDGKKQNCDHLSKLHLCLVPFDQLDEADALYERISGKNPNYKHADDAIIKHLKEIVLLRR